MSSSSASSNLRRLALSTSVVAVATLVAACGGGGGDNSAGTASTALTPASTSASYAQGAVSGFGSVIVGGVRYDDSKARVMDASGNALPLGAVKLGSMVTVDAGVVDRLNLSAVANSFRVADEVLGPVSAINTSASTLTVLGQAVVVNASTVFDTTLSGGLGALAVGAVVEVHGLPDATSGQITATRIESKTAATSYELHGTVAALDSAARTFKIGTALISYAGVAAASVPSTLANGSVVRLRLATVQTAGAWVASSFGIDPRPPLNIGDSHVEGAITVLTSTTSFEVAGLKVDATTATFPDGTTGIVLGAKVEVNGSLNNGVLLATKVELEDKPANKGLRPMELHGAISALDSTAKTFTLRNVTVSYGGTVIYTGGTVADLANGKNLAAFGVLSSDRTKLEAQRIVFAP